MLDRAYVLSSRAYLETDALVNFFTESQGRICLLAHRVRSPNSSWAGFLQPFNLLEISRAGKNDLQYLKSLDLLAVRRKFPAENLLAGLYLNELLTRLCYPGVAYPELFRTYSQLLTELAAELTTLEREIKLCIFEIAVLKYLGYGLQLTVPENFSAHPATYYCYHPAQGLVPASSAYPATWPRLSRSDLADICELNFTQPTTLQVTKKLLRSIFDYYLGDKPLSSRKNYVHEF